MRKQLEQDIKGSMNKDAADVVKDLMEKYNALVDLLEANKADISAVDFEAEKISID